jgi:hypothetical protein
MGEGNDAVLRGDPYDFWPGRQCTSKEGMNSSSPGISPRVKCVRQVSRSAGRKKNGF